MFMDHTPLTLLNIAGSGVYSNSRGDWANRLTLWCDGSAATFYASYKLVSGPLSFASSFSCFGKW